MNDTSIKSLQYLVIIASKKKRETFLGLLKDYGVRTINTVYGHGSMSPSALAAAFGFEAEQGKVLITCLVQTEKAKELMEVLYKDYHFDKPNTGIAFSVAVEGLAF